jgi:peptidoglycan/LPS O-acetylase OafA/YrhL
MDSPRSNRNQSLDVLRCIAILLVLAAHVPYYQHLAQLGWIGVDLFFVLSGFLISGLLFSEFKSSGGIDFPRFFIRRGLKIWPPFFFFVTWVIVSQLAVRPHHVQWHTVAANVLFLQNYFGSPGTLLDHTWSLAVEEHFYVLLPLLFMLLIYLRRKARNPFESVPVIFVTLAVVCLALRWQYGYREALMTHLRLDSLFSGVMLGYLYHFRRVWFKKLTGNYGLAITMACCLPAAFIDRLRYQVLGLTVLFVGFGFLLCWAVDRKPQTKMGEIALAVPSAIGFYSYSIYLWHPIVLNVLASHFKLGFSVFWFCIVACIGIGIGMAILIETPSLAWRNKRFPGPKSSSKAAVSGQRLPDHQPLLK